MGSLVTYPFMAAFDQPGGCLCLGDPLNEFFFQSEEVSSHH